MCSLAPGLILLREDWLHQLVTGSRTVNSSQINPEVRLVTRWRLRREVSTDASITYAHASLPKRTSPIYLPTHTHTHTHTHRETETCSHMHTPTADAGLNLVVRAQMVSFWIQARSMCTVQAPAFKKLLSFPR